MADPDLFHITRVRDAHAIFRDGLLKDSEPPAAKQAGEIAAEHGVDDHYRELSPTEQAEHWFDEVVDDAQRAVEGASHYPTHQPAVFFWPTRAAAEQSRKSVGWQAVIVAVDREKIPCRCAIGPVDGLDAIFKDYYDTARSHGTFDPETQFQRAKEWWREVEWYDGQTHRRHEVWCGCDVPPHAIEWIYDPRSGRRIYEPPAADQRRLIDYEP